MSCNKILKETGHRLTPQRRLILDLIHDAHRHVGAEEIFDYVQTRAPGVNKSTIYRTLKLLEQMGCVFKSEHDDRIIYHHAEEGHHHHLICQSCGKSFECEEGLFFPVQRAIEEKYGFWVEFRHMVLSGLCSECKGKK
jgi:Fur family ferric uptake transcriptional regulator